MVITITYLVKDRKGGMKTHGEIGKEKACRQDE